MEPAKVLNMKIADVDGKPCVVFIAKDAGGRPIETAFPVAGVWDIFSRIAQMAASLPPEKAPDPNLYRQALLFDPGLMQVGSTADGKAVLSFRTNAPDALHLSLSPNDALALADALRDQAANLLEDQGKPKN